MLKNKCTNENQFTNEIKCKNKNECRNELEYRNENEYMIGNDCWASSVMEMYAILMEMKAWIKQYNWMDKTKYLNEIFIHKTWFAEVQKGSK